MALKKITETEMDQQGVCAAPDVLDGTPSQNKALFDRMVRQLVAPAVNTLVDAVETAEENQEKWSAEEQKRVAAESGRTAAESERVTAEQDRITAEQSRVEAEQLRSDAEELRTSAEQVRISNEDDRETKEAGRSTEEAQRITAEQSRVAAEQARAAAEELRSAAEADRQSKSDAMQVWEEYDSSKAYVPLNKVAYNGSSYICVNPCTGVAPDNENYWLMIARKGVDGATVSASGQYGFAVENGHLILYYTGETPPDFTIDENGHLILNFDDTHTMDIGAVVGPKGEAGISTTAKNLLITILRSGVYTADQSDNITALETALGGGTTEPEEPDVPVEKTYAISNELINCTSSNIATSAKENAVYTATLTANDGYTLTGGTVTVTMGGVDITDTAYADGVISIAAVTGDVEIFASAVAVQAEAALPEDGLIAYFDYRTATYDNAGSGGKTTIAPTKGSGQLFVWANNSISMQNEYGLKPANTRSWMYDQNGGTNQTALGDSVTVIQLTYGEVPGFGFNYSNFGAWWAFYPQYINASGSTAYAAQVNGSNFNSDNKRDYNFTVVRADGSTLTEIFDTSRTTYNGGDIDGFSRWLDTPLGNTRTYGDTVYCTAMAIYNRALTDSEIEAAREFMKTLEVTA